MTGHRDGDHLGRLADLSYFVALLAGGGFILLMAVRPWLSVFPEFAGGRAVPVDAEGRRVLAFVAGVCAWTLGLAVTWWRAGRLVPLPRRVRHPRRLRIGLTLILGGHLVAATAVLLKPMGVLLTSPLYVMLVCYGTGTLLTESARRSGKAALATLPG